MMEPILNEFEGGLKELKINGQFNIKKLLDFGTEGFDIVTTCPTCAYALKHDYNALGINGAELLLNNVYDLGQYLLMLKSKGQLKTSFNVYPKHFAYHKPCHLHVDMKDYNTTFLLIFWLRSLLHLICHIQYFG